MLATLLILKIVFWSMIDATHLNYTIEEAKNLSKTLFNGYSNKIRPIWNQGESLPISVSYWLSAVNEISAVQQKMTTTGYLSVKWTDVSLQWSVEETGIDTMLFNQVSILSVCLSVCRSVGLSVFQSIDRSACKLQKNMF